MTASKEKELLRLQASRAIIYFLVISKPFIGPTGDGAPTPLRARVCGVKPLTINDIHEAGE